MSKEKQIQYYAKITGALGDVFNEDSEYFIDVYADDFNANDFLHVLATRVPQMIFLKLTGKETDPLEFNHICNRLIFQDKKDERD